MLLGRKGRLWWRNLPEAEKTDLRNHLKRNRGLIAGSSIALAIFLGSFGYGSVSFYFFFTTKLHGLVCLNVLLPNVFRKEVGSK